MALTNPTPILYENLNLALQQEKNSVQSEPVKSKGLLSSTKQKEVKLKDDMLNPSRRVASYVKMIQAKREEIKNGTA